MGTDASPDAKWEQARLIPTAGIRGKDEQEKRATSALLAVIHAVPDFARTLLKTVGAPKGKVSTFTEVRLEGNDGATHIPDGAIVVTRGKSRWTCLVEVKTDRSVLETEQITRYLESARKHEFDALLTISNQIRTSDDHLPFAVDKRKVGKLTVKHASWWRIQTEAIMQHRFRGVDDPDQALILSELIRYLDDPKSGASGFTDMGKEWAQVRDAAKNETLRAEDPGAVLIAERWEQFVEYLALRLSQELGVAVAQRKTRNVSSEEKTARITKTLVDAGVLQSHLKIPGAVGPIGIEANLRTGRLTTSVELAAPGDGKRPKTKINWLLRQLTEAPRDLRVEVRFAKSRRTNSELLEKAADNPECLLLDDDRTREPRNFLLAWSQELGRKRGRADGSFVAETKRQVIEFYGDLVQNLNPPPRRPPQLSEKGDPDEETNPTVELADLASPEPADPAHGHPVPEGLADADKAGRIS